jgi:hypothetical protein
MESATEIKKKALAMEARAVGLTVEEVIEIRCIAENDHISLEAHLDADATKEKRFSRPSRSST